MTRIGGTLNLEEERCPLPVGRIERALDALPRGTALRVVASDPTWKTELKAFSRRTGHEIVDQSEGGGEIVFLLIPDWSS